MRIRHNFSRPCMEYGAGFSRKAGILHLNTNLFDTLFFAVSAKHNAAVSVELNGGSAF